jgi:hypothetical protein
MDLPRKWPGRVKVRQALTLMRLTGRWGQWPELYAKASKSYQKNKYQWFREAFYWEIHGLHPEHPKVKRIGR